MKTLEKNTELKNSVIAAYADYFDEYVCAMTEDGSMSLHDAIDFVYDQMDTDTDYCCTEAIIQGFIDEGILTEDEVWGDDWIGASIIHEWGMVGVNQARGAAEAEDFMQMNDIVGRYQAEFDGYVADLHEIADRKSAIRSKLSSLRAYAILKKIEKLGDDFLTALGDYTHCDMCPADGYWFDADELSIWAYGYADYMDEDDIACLRSEIWDDAIYDEDIVPMTEDEFAVFCDLTEDTYGHATEGYTLSIGVEYEDYKTWENYNWDTLADMAMEYKTNA